MQYDESANGREISVRQSEEFEIVLSETRSTGFHWTISEAGDPNVQLAGNASEPNETGIGGAGRHQWRFRAISSGETEIKLQYLRSWETSSKPARTFTLKVRVES